MSSSLRARRPIHALPVELVGEVFAIWLIISKGTRIRNNVPFIASAVCHRWRSIALGTPTLWMDVAVWFHTTNKWRDASWIAYLKCFRERSGTVPLKVALHLSANFDIQPALWDELGLLFNKAQSVDARTDGKHAQLILRLWSADFPHLRHLRIASPYNPYVLQYPVAERAPRLRSLALDCVQWPWSATAELAHLDTLAWRATTKAYISDLAAAFSKLPNLEKLSVEANDVDFPSVTHAVSTANARELTLYLKCARPSALPQAFPQLQVARFVLEYCSDNWQSSQTFLRSLPNPHLLVCLDISRAYLDFTAIHGLRAVPNLQELVLRDCRLRPGCGDIFDKLKDNCICRKLTRLLISWDMERFDRRHFDISASTLLELVRARRSPESQCEPFQRVEMRIGASHDDEYDKKLQAAMAD